MTQLRVNRRSENHQTEIAFLKKVCREIHQPFTVFDITNEMQNRRMCYPTTSQIKNYLWRLPFIKKTDVKQTRTGRITRYIYVELE